MSTGPAETIDIEAIATENAALRQQLLAENERLRAALAESQAQNVQAQGLTDEDVRRLEHPEEFVAAENDEFRATLEHLRGELAKVHAARAAAASSSSSDTAKDPGPVPEIAPVEKTADEQVDTSSAFAAVSDADLQAEIDRRKTAAGQ